MYAHTPSRPARRVQGATTPCVGLAAALVAPDLIPSYLASR